MWIQPLITLATWARLRSRIFWIIGTGLVRNEYNIINSIGSYNAKSSKQLNKKDEVTFYK
jgi:hypothetical protein